MTVLNLVVLARVLNDFRGTVPGEGKNMVPRCIQKFMYAWGLAWGAVLIYELHAR